MNDPSQKSAPMTSGDLRSVTSSPASADGPTPSDLLDGKTRDLFGQVVVPVNLSQVRGKALAPPIRATFGLPFSSSSQSADLQQLLENKLLGQMDVHGSILFSLTWKDQHTASGRRICALLASGRRTSDSDSTGWPTPTTLNTTSEKAQTGRETKGPSRGGASFGLEDIAQRTSWPTPVVRDTAEPGQLNEKSQRVWANGKTHGPLICEIAELTSWPTPRTSDMNGAEEHGNGGKDLRTKAVGTWPTPNVMDSFPFKETPEERKAAGHQVGLVHEVRLTETAPENQAGWATPKANEKIRSEEFQDGRALSPVEISGPPSSGSPAETGKRAQLNPRFSLWLMGYPTEWASCGERVTRLSQKSPLSSSERIARQIKKIEAELTVLRPPMPPRK